MGLLSFLSKKSKKEGNIGVAQNIKGELLQKSKYVEQLISLISYNPNSAIVEQRNFVGIPNLTKSISSLNENIIGSITKLQTSINSAKKYLEEKESLSEDDKAKLKYLVYLYERTNNLIDEFKTESGKIVEWGNKVRELEHEYKVNNNKNVIEDLIKNLNNLTSLKTKFDDQQKNIKEIESEISNIKKSIS
jgi:small-conductance mechanosensitive channel